MISDLGGKEQPIKIQYFNIGNNNDFYWPLSILKEVCCMKFSLIFIIVLNIMFWELFDSGDKVRF